MSYKYNLSGSPLGLLNVLSRASNDGMSTFNGGESRNIDVNRYNNGLKEVISQTGGYNQDQQVSARVSLFTGGALPNFWGNISQNWAPEYDTLGVKNEYKGIDREQLHNDRIYDTSLLNIIEQLSNSKKAALRPQDFAYLKNVGVYPNNRLVIARRFLNPQKDNIFDSSKDGDGPLSVLITWKKPTEDIIDINFGEEWEDAEASFTSIFNSLAKDYSFSEPIPTGGVTQNITTMPAFTENLQRLFLEKIGVLDPSSNRDAGGNNLPLPSGNPNIIKKAKRRKLIANETAGSGLSFDVRIKMDIEYEQKFISGIDPTVAWMDILSNALIFSTSDSQYWGVSSKLTKTLDDYTKKGGINEIIENISDSLDETLKSIKSKIENTIKGSSEENTESSGEQKQDNPDKLEEIKSKAENLANSGIDLILDTLQSTLSKYRIKIMGVAQALSGLPSTPWHVTIGNPLRPIFCSGDMYIEQKVKISMGKNLAFNDLPSTMNVDLTLVNARPLGLQEILAKFNTGYLRSVNYRKDYINDLFPISDNNEDKAYRYPISGSASNNTQSSTESTETDANTNQSFKDRAINENINSPFLPEDQEVPTTKEEPTQQNLSEELRNRMAEAAANISAPIDNTAVVTNVAP